MEWGREPRAGLDRRHQGAVITARATCPGDLKIPETFPAGATHDPHPTISSRVPRRLLSLVDAGNHPPWNCRLPRGPQPGLVRGITCSRARSCTSSGLRSLRGSSHLRLCEQRAWKPSATCWPRALLGAKPFIGMRSTPPNHGRTDRGPLLRHAVVVEDDELTARTLCPIGAQFPPTRQSVYRFHRNARLSMTPAIPVACSPGIDAGMPPDHVHSCRSTFLRCSRRISPGRPVSSDSVGGFALARVR